MDIGHGESGHPEAVVVQPGGTQRRLHDLAEGPVVPGVDRMQGDPHLRRGLRLRYP